MTSRAILIALLVGPTVPAISAAPEPSPEVVWRTVFTDNGVRVPITIGEDIDVDENGNSYQAVAGITFTNSCFLHFLAKYGPDGR